MKKTSTAFPPKIFIISMAELLDCYLENERENLRDTDLCCPEDMRDLAKHYMKAAKFWESIITPKLFWYGANEFGILHFDAAPSFEIAEYLREPNNGVELHIQEMDGKVACKIRLSKKDEKWFLKEFEE
jgi:hypothetical protein